MPKPIPPAELGAAFDTLLAELDLSGRTADAAAGANLAEAPPESGEQTAADAVRANILAYQRGEYRAVLDAVTTAAKQAGNQRSEAATIALRLVLSYTAQPAALSIGRVDWFLKGERWLRAIAASDAPIGVHRTAELSATLGRLAAADLRHVPAWLRAADFSQVPRGVRLNASYAYALWLLLTRANQQALTASVLALGLATRPGPAELVELNLHTMAARAALALGEVSQAADHVEAVVSVCVERQLTTTLAENIRLMGGLVEQSLAGRDPQLLAAVERQFEIIAPNWRAAHERLTGGKMQFGASLRDGEIAVLAERKMPVREIARLQGLSYGHTANILSEYYARNGLKSRRDLQSPW